MSRGAGAGRAMQSLLQDEAVRGHKLAPGTMRRVLGFARPYQRIIVGFLILIAVDASLGVATPLLFRQIIDAGIMAGREGVVIWLSLAVALLAVASAVVSLGQRWVSGRLGESLVYDLRTAVFNHVQRMPLAFFSRTQTGALIQRLDGDVLGAQQAFSTTLANVVSNVLGIAMVLGVMFVLSWQITLLALLLLPLFLLPARFMARRLRTLTEQRYRK